MFRLTNNLICAVGNFEAKLVEMFFVQRTVAVKVENFFFYGNRPFSQC